MTLRIAGRGARLTLAVVACALAGLPAAQAGGAATDRTSVAVRYDDLNLATDSGVRTLYARLRHAAERVCPDSAARDLARLQLARSCQAQAIDAAVAQVASPRLAALRARDAVRG
jgi:UrcA family protein